MSDLHLHVKTEYFEDIREGRKRKEYRLYNAYWIRRLGHVVCSELLGPYLRRTYNEQCYDRVFIYNAYKKATPENVMIFPWNGWDIETITHPHFGPDPVTVFAIKLEK